MTNQISTVNQIRHSESDHTKKYTAFRSVQLVTVDSRIAQTEAEYGRERENCFLTCESTDKRFAERLDPLRSDRQTIAASISRLSSIGSGSDLLR